MAAIQAALLRIILVVLGGLFLTRSGAAAENTLPITIGYQSTPDWLVLTARELRLFEKAGLAPTYTKFIAGAPMIAAAQEKTVDVVSIGSVPFLLGLSQEVEWVAIGVSEEGAYVEGIVARKDSGIATPADLKGKRVGYFRNSTAHYAVLLMLRQYGIRVDQVQLVHLSPAEQLEAMAKNEIDAAVAWEPWMQRMIHEANGRIIAIEGDLGIYTNTNGYSARREWLRGNREAAVRFLRALAMAYDALQKNPAVGVRAMAAELGIKEEWAETIYRNSPPPKVYEWANPRYQYSVARDGRFHRRLGHVATFLFDEKAISKSVDLRDALDASVINEVLRTRK